MKQVFRSRTALALGWIWMAFAAANAVDLIVRYSGPSSLTAAAVLGVMTALVFITCLRPAIILTGDGVLVRNPIRNTYVPWEAVDEVAVSHSIKITSGDGSVRCWAPQTSARERAAAVRRGNPVRTGGRFRTEPARSKGEQAAAEALAGKTHADWVAEQITERAESAKRAAAMTVPPPAAEHADGPGVRSAEPPAAGAGAMKVTWAPSALAALLAAVILVVAAFLA
ncbi:hypothetical protein FHR32_004066 [Streptosporangium album]|uniref:Low molecular weight protein antigen 6 PH domain-containing protein n=1 Tax=Streptosporangium album TaxID=47479 RepID=A0A7W7RYP6_9ACTN|nr:PH domain-containing protein [Streptosporangium album]MBB4939761.1 hypothetical protein [Streptosporangium album]